MIKKYIFNLLALLFMRFGTRCILKQNKTFNIFCFKSLDHLLSFPFFKRFKYSCNAKNMSFPFCVKLHFS